MKHTLQGILFGLLFASTVALAEDIPTFKVLMKGGRIFPETVAVPAATRFRLEIRNEGPGAAEFESLELRKELVLAPGVTRTMVFAPLKPGSYAFFDDFHPDTGQARLVAQ